MAVLSERSHTSFSENDSLDPLIETVSCLACGSDKSVNFISAVDDLSGMPGTFTFVRCKRCGLVYQNPRISVEHIKAYYDDEYIAYRKRSDWGIFTRFHSSAMLKHDREKAALVRRYHPLTKETSILDLGCAVGSFGGYLKQHYGANCSGVDFKDFHEVCQSKGVEFYQGLVYELSLPAKTFDVVTMWHFLEHDYQPKRTLEVTREILKDEGTVIIEVPCLDSASFKVFGNRWPGLQAPQHTALYSKESLIALVESSGLKCIDYLPYGAFPPFFYWYAGFIFHFTKGRGVNFRKHIAPYFFAQLLTSPFFALFGRRNLAMQTVICIKA